jgi:TetR/AcrR family transcriptional regulator, fatty acid metabolism regulator protein
MDDNKKEQIRKAALAVFSRQGFHETTVEQIAQEAGIAKGTIYLYYTSKEEILISIFRRYLDEMLDFADHLLDSAPSLPEMLAGLFRKQVDLLREEPGLIKLFVRRSLHAVSHGDERMVEFNRYLVERIVKLLKRARKTGEVRSFDVRIVACALLSLQETLPLYLMTYAGKLPNDAPARVARQLSQFMWAGIRSEPA